MSETVTADGQVTIPKDVRDQLGIGPGSKVTFIRRPDGTVEFSNEETPLKASRFGKFLGHAGPGLSTDEVMEMTRGEV